MPCNDSDRLLAEAVDLAGFPDIAWDVDLMCVDRMPKSFHTSMDLTIAALNALGLEWEFEQWGYPGERRFSVWVYASKSSGYRKEELINTAPAAIAEALVTCAINVLSEK